jgi:hypothetical protein
MGENLGLAILPPESILFIFAAFYISIDAENGNLCWKNPHFPVYLKNLR